MSQILKPDEPTSPFAYQNDFMLEAYHRNLNDARRNAFALEDKELIKSLSSAKKCYHIFKSRGDENTAQFFQMFYHCIKAEISIRWRGV